MTVGRLLELILRGPTRLRSREFSGRVRTYRGTAPTWPIATDPGPLRRGEEEVLEVSAGSWSHGLELAGGGRRVRPGPPAQPWWELDRPGIQEHLDPGLLLSSLYDLRAAEGVRGPVLRGKVIPNSDMDELAALVYGGGGDGWQGVVDPRLGVLLDARWIRAGRVGFRSELALELRGRPQPPPRPLPEWEAALESMAGASAALRRTDFRARVVVSYAPEAVSVARERHPASTFSGGFEWRGWRRRLFPVGVRGIAQEWASLEDHARRLDPELPQPPGAGFDSAAQLVVRRGTWEARVLPVRSELDPYGFGSGGPCGPGWLRDGRTRPPEPALGEMLDPVLVLASVRLRRVRPAPDGWRILGTPRPADRAHGYGASVVHPRGDRWEAVVDRDTGALLHCRTLRRSRELSAHRLTLERI